MDGELIRDDAHHVSAKYLIILQYLLLDSEFMEAAWVRGGGGCVCVGGGSLPAASHLWALY